MKPEFLKNLKVGDQPLTQEVVDAIMAEHQRTVAKAVKPYADYDAIKDQLKTATDGLKAFEGVDVAQLQGQIAKLQGDLTAKEAEHQAQLADMAFNGALEAAITTARGRNAKAIRALLDEQALKGSKNQEADIKAALDGVKKDNPYLFEEGEGLPYAPGTGTGGPNRQYTQEELGKMSMAEYRQYRQGK